MNMTVSIPDDLHAEAERLTRRLGIPLSQLYAEAVREYVARHDPEAVTDALNRLYETEDSRSDPAVASAARRLLQRAEW